MKLTAKAAHLPILQNLQVLRGFAACCLLFRHALHEVKVTTDLPFDPSQPHFTIGIDIFFVLSGFIMVYTSQNLFAQKGAWAYFMIRRVIRIVPLYWFYTFAMGAVALAAPHILSAQGILSVSGFVKSLFFIPYVNTAGYIRPFFDVGWTLNYEMYFYVVFAALLFLRMRYMIAGLVLYFGAGYFLFHSGISDNAYLLLYTRPLVLEFLFGGLLGALYVKGIRLPAWTLRPAYGVCILLLLAIAFPDSIGGINHYSWTAMSITMLLVACLTLPKGAEAQNLPAWSRGIGDASYSIYLSHPFALGAVTQVISLMGLQNTLSPWLVFALCIVVALIGGYIAYLCIEKPMTRWLKNRIVK